jgi:hypothetical protein
MLFLILAAAAVAAPADAPWESYVCENGPTIRLALNETRPAEQGWLETDSGVVALVRHEGEGKTVLRGGGYMVVAPNWIDILYAPPGKEKAAYSCRIANATSAPGKPSPE